MIYFNPDEDNAIECNFEMPQDPDTFIQKLDIEIDDKVINTILLEKAKAKERYEDAIAGGKLGLIAEKVTVGDEYLNMRIGNLQPKKEIKIVMQLVQPLKVIGSAYQFLLPTSFYPDYSKFSKEIDVSYPYKFSYSVLIKSTSTITLISKPENSECKREKSGKFATIFCTEPSRELRVYYRTNNMMTP